MQRPKSGGLSCEQLRGEALCSDSTTLQVVCTQSSNDGMLAAALGQAPVCSALPFVNIRCSTTPASATSINDSKLHLPALAHRGNSRRCHSLSAGILSSQELVLSTSVLTASARGLRFLRVIGVWTVVSVPASRNRSCQRPHDRRDAVCICRALLNISQ